MRQILTVLLWALIAVMGGLIWWNQAFLPGTSLQVKLLGPGKEPALCYQRAYGHFLRLEPDLTDVSERMLASGDIDTMIAAPLPGSSFLNVSATTRKGEDRPLNDTEKEAFQERFKSMAESGNLFAPMIFTRTNAGRGIVARPYLSCGASSWSWFSHGDRYRSQPKTPWPFNYAVETTFVYRPSEAPRHCDEAFPVDGVFRCAMRLDDNWNWTFAWYDLDAS
ncbi:MAG: hypothetical protein HRU11_12085, partial [Parvularculaceae bacterium]|nr:hypothetical protein [Parvularculaceae bacterium]